MGRNEFIASKDNLDGKKDESYDRKNTNDNTNYSFHGDDWSAGRVDTWTSELVGGGLSVKCMNETHS